MALLALPAGAHLLRPGFWSSADGLHHLHRVSELTRYLVQGALYPRWIGEFAFGYGVPAFNFYSPLSYYLAQPFAWLGPLWALKLAMLGGLAASAVLLFHWARRHVGLIPAFAAALVYAYAPYRLVDIFPRAAFAEHMAFLWLPLILWAYDGLWAGRRRIWQVLSWAGLVLTHSFTAVMFAPFFAIYMLVSAWHQHSWRPLLRALLPLGLAVGLTAFFWLPLLAEARYAGLGAAEVSAGYANHLVSLPDLVGGLAYDYATGGGRPDYYFAFGLIPAAILSLGLLCLLLSKPAVRWLAAFGSVAALGSLFMVSRLSAPVWGVLAPVLANIQFPWRFLAIGTLGLALVTTTVISALPGERLRWIGAGAVAVVLLASGLWRLPFVSQPMVRADLRPEALWQFDLETGQAGTTWGGEFLPIWVSEQRWALGRAPDDPLDGPSISPLSVGDLQRIGDGYRLTVESDQAWVFRLHTYYFPGWQARLDGAPAITEPSGDLGLVSAHVPAGRHELTVAFEPTPVRHVARWLSAASLAALPLIALWSLGRARRWISAAWAAGVLVGAVVAPVLPRPAIIAPVQALFGEQAQLVGARLPAAARPGQSLVVEVYWLALRQMGRNDKVFVHLVNESGEVVAQHDGDPGGGYTPTSRWQAGELIPDRHYLELPADLPPGRYLVKAGMYQFAPMRLLLTAPAEPDGRVDLGGIVVR